MKLFSLIAPAILAGSAYAGESFLLSEKGSAALAPLQGYAELQSQSYAAGDNFASEYLVPSASRFQTQALAGYDLVKLWENLPVLNVSIALYTDKNKKELVISFTSGASPSTYFDENNSQLVPYVPGTGDAPSTPVSTSGATLGSDKQATPVSPISVPTVPSPISGLEAKAHKVALRAAKYAWTFLKPFIKSYVKQFPGMVVRVLGHSLGGPLAGITGLELKDAGFGNVKVMTYGSPRYGNSDLAELTDRYFNNSLTFENLAEGNVTGFIRHAHDFDIITGLPSSDLGYAPAGLEVYLTNQELPVTPEDVVVCAPGSVNCDGLEKFNPPSVYSGVDNIFTELYKAHSLYYTYQVPSASNVAKTIGKSRASSDETASIGDLLTDINTLGGTFFKDLMNFVGPCVENNGLIGCADEVIKRIQTLYNLIKTIAGGSGL